MVYVLFFSQNPRSSQAFFSPADGWFEVEKTAEGKVFGAFPLKCEVLHWHGDTFDLPQGCKNLVRSAACENQAFLYENTALALQFHLEVSEGSLQGMVDALVHELEGDKNPWVQNRDEILAGASQIANLEPILIQILERFLVVSNHLCKFRQSRQRLSSI